VSDKVVGEGAQSAANKTDNPIGMTARATSFDGAAPLFEPSQSVGAVVSPSHEFQISGEGG
jgi:hypothetical protein